MSLLGYRRFRGGRVATSRPFLISVLLPLSRVPRKGWSKDSVGPFFPQLAIRLSFPLGDGIPT